MRDFASKSANKKKRKTLVAFLKSCVAFFIKFIKLSLTLLASLLLFGLLVWVILPHLITPQHHRSIVFINYIENGYEGEMLFASFDADINKIKAYLITQEHQANFINEQTRSVESIAFNTAVEDLEIEKINTTQISWLTGRVVNEVVLLSGEKGIELSKLHNLTRLLKEKLFSDLASVKKIADIKKMQELFYLLLVLRKMDYDFIPQESNLPQTAVLPDNCAAAVINTTDIVDYASTFTSILETSGARVIRVDTGFQDRTYEQSVLAFNQEKKACNLLAELLQENLFIQPLQQIRGPQAESLLNRYRADLIILLGANY